jgi:hypothetical protein
MHEESQLGEDRDVIINRYVERAIEDMDIQAMETILTESLTMRLQNLSDSEVHSEIKESAYSEILEDHE